MTDNQKRIRLENAIISYPALFTPRPKMDDETQFEYSAVFIVPADSPDAANLRKAALAAAQTRWGFEAEGMLRSGKLLPGIRDDVEAKGYPEGSVFITAKSRYRPGVVGRRIDPSTGKLRTIDESDQEAGGEYEIFAGCKVRATVRAFGYDKKMKKGVTWSLDNVQLLDNENVTRLDGRRAAADEFDDLADNPASGQGEYPPPF